MMLKNKKPVDKVILISITVMASLMLGWWLFQKRANRNYYLPESFQGWVTIKFSVTNAPDLPKNGSNLEIFVPDSGYLETATPLRTGWGKDRFFVKKNGKYEQIPSYQEENGEIRIFIHQRIFLPLSFENMLGKLSVGTDTTFFDGTRIKVKSQDEIDYQAGKPRLEYFYFSGEPQPLSYEPPVNPHQEGLDISKFQRNSVN